MCFETTKSARAKIAKEDIECWKLLESEGQPFYQDKLDPYIKDFLNPIVKIEKMNMLIHEGYHSFKKIRFAEQFQRLWHGRGVIRKFIIPAGTRYYSNRAENVSETIMLVE